MDANKDNPASWRTMESLGAVHVKDVFDDENATCVVKDYEIDVDESINANTSIYEPLIVKTISRK